MRVGFHITLERNHIHHANSKLIFTPKYPEFRMKVRYFLKILKKQSVIYARLINQYKFKYRTVFSARFDKQEIDNHVLDETDLFLI